MDKSSFQSIFRQFGGIVQIQGNIFMQNIVTEIRGVHIFQHLSSPDLFFHV